MNDLLHQWPDKLYGYRIVITPPTVKVRRSLHERVASWPYEFRSIWVHMPNPDYVPDGEMEVDGLAGVIRCNRNTYRELRRELDAMGCNP